LTPVSIDIHQHLWTEGLYEALARRDAPPRVRRADGSWRLELAGEEPFTLPAEPHDPARRAAALHDEGVDLALVSLSCALGVETLPDAEARAVIEAWEHDADALPAPLSAWGSVALADPDPHDVDVALDRGRVGIALPATALDTPAALDRLAPLLERLAARDAPLFIHPGPARPGAWLPALTSYVASLTAAWHAWTLHGRPRHPRLRVLFAALAGLAPLHAERVAARLDARAAAAGLADPLTFYDTSSYGPRAIGAVAAAVGTGAIVHGTDWPYARAAVPAAETDPSAAAALLGSRRPVAVVA
jgi:predicted TIM-barrel fold metal-dependent hydrolase